MSAAVDTRATPGPGVRTEHVLRARRRRPGVAAAKTLGIVALLAFSLFPAYWMFSSAIDPEAATRGARLLPAGVTWDNFVTVIDDGGFGHYLRNSVLVALGTVLASSVVALLAAVAAQNEENRQAVLRAAGSLGKLPAEDYVHEELAWRLEA